MKRNLPYTGPIALATVLVLAYLSSEPFRGEVSATISILLDTDTGSVREYLLEFGWWAPIVSTLLQIVTAILAPLPAVMLALANAMLYGAWWGGLLTWSGALAGAAICFAIARLYGRPVVERFVPATALDATDRFFVRWGIFAVVVARVLPFINPDFVSYAAGLTPMRWRVFLGSIAIGSIPSTAVYSYLGSRGDTSLGWIVFPLLIAGLLAFLVAAFHHYRVTPAAPVASRENPGEIG